MTNSNIVGKVSYHTYSPTKFLIAKIVSVGFPSRRDRANKMLELLYENGLEGEATIANCRQLKKLILAKKEIEDLDPTLIIATEGTFSYILYLRTNERFDSFRESHAP